MLVSKENIEQASKRLQNVAFRTALQYNAHLSDMYNCHIYLKREDLQVVRSYKLRGAYNLMSSLSSEQLSKGVVCASAGNHAQGVAFSCQAMKVLGKIFMPSTTPRQKVGQVKMFGKEYVEVILTGDTFDDSYLAATEYCTKTGKQFIHPFDDLKVIEGQGTVGLEILEDIDRPIDYLILPVGGGGLSSGTGSYFTHVSPSTKIIGVEPEGAPAMLESIKQGEVITLDTIDKFVDGAAVRRVGETTFKICQEVLDNVILVPEGKVCSTIIKLYNEEAIVVEPAGSLSIAALDQLKDEIQGKCVVCVVSGSNNDLDRMQEIKERSLIYEGLKYYFLIRFPQRAGALRDFLDKVLSPTDDITRFEYAKKSIKESGPAIVGIEVKSKEDYNGLIERMHLYKMNFTVINDDPTLFEYLI